MKAKLKYVDSPGHRLSRVDPGVRRAEVSVVLEDGRRQEGYARMAWDNAEKCWVPVRDAEGWLSSSLKEFVASSVAAPFEESASRIREMASVGARIIS